MNKEDILREVKRTAEANGGTPLGIDRFSAETGIRPYDWEQHWARWGDAVKAAGLAANRFESEGYADTELLERFAKFARELGRLPTRGDLRVKRRNDSKFPCADVFHRRWKMAVLVETLLGYCRSHEGYGDVARLCEEYVPRRPDVSRAAGVRAEQIGYVYLIKSGHFYKIGKTNDAGRRNYELAIQLPERAEQVHVIRTDDPFGIEAYWHKRFEEKRKNGEWFDLDATDIAAFKRRKFM
jgi:hypothetical protein